jgi:flavin-dependent dehydrogenase
MSGPVAGASGQDAPSVSHLHWDAAVVGAGLAGLITSRLLADHGHRVLLIDHKREVDQGITTTGIFVRRTLEDFDLPRAHLGPVVRQVTLHSPRGRRTTFVSSNTEFRVGRMAELYRHYLDQARSAGVVWYPGAHYLDSRPGSTGTTVRLRHRGVEQVISTRLLIGADGAQSRVAGDLGLSRNRSWIVGVEDVLQGVPLSGPPCFHCFLDPVIAPGYLAWLVHDGHEVHLGVGGDGSRFDPRAALEAFRVRAGAVIDLRDARLVERRGGLIPVNGILDRIGNSRGLLVGDAAGAVSPLTAGGLDPCFRLSREAARVSHRFLQSDDAAELTAYRGASYQRRFVIRRLLRSVWGSIRSRWVVEAALRALGASPGRTFARSIFFGHGSFPDPAPRPLAKTILRSSS